MNSSPGVLRQNAGTTAVEFAFTAPVFFALLMGVIEIGLVMWTQFGLQYGSDAAARCSAVDTTNCGTSHQVAAYAASHALGLSLPSSAFSLSTTGCGNQVSGSYAYRFYVPFFTAPTITLTAQSCFPS